jgi:hypothetical protein
MQELKKPIFIIATLGIAFHQILQKILHIPLPFIDNYADDFFAMPFVLTIFSAEQRHLWKHLNRPLNGFEIAVFTLVLGLFFEEILPKYHAGFTKDYWDYLAYSLGSLWYQSLSRR